MAPRLSFFFFFVSVFALSPKIKEEIESNRETAERIIDFLVEGDGKGQTFSRLSTLTDNFGNRLAGSQALEDAIDFILDELEHDG